MPAKQEYECFDSTEEDGVLRIIEKYPDHPSIKLIKAKNKNKSHTVSFR